MDIHVARQAVLNVKKQTVPTSYCFEAVKMPTQKMWIQKLPPPD